MQHRAHEIGNLVDNRREQVPAQVGRRLELLIGARTGRAQEIAAVGHFQIKADRRTPGDLGALVRDRLMVAARIDGRGSAWHFTGTTHCDAFVAAVWVLQAVKAQASKRPPNRIDLVTILGM